MCVGSCSLPKYSPIPTITSARRISSGSASRRPSYQRATDGRPSMTPRTTKPGVVGDRPFISLTAQRVGEVDDGVVTAVLVGEVGIGRPIVLPARAVEEVAEAVRPSRLERHVGDEHAVVAGHGVCVDGPVVELTDDRRRFGVDLCWQPKADYDRAVTLGWLLVDHGGAPLLV